uniref:Integrase core domain containing protein n=1 Tax=Solanum tuberosum TaxID=4113 RepID=M1DI70_SOLTU
MQRSTDPIDGPSFIPRTVNGVSRPQSGEEDTLIGSLTRSGSDSASNSAAGSGSGSDTVSSAHEAAASSDEAFSSDGNYISQNDQSDPVDGEPNRWCIEGQWQIYRDTMMKNRHKCEWMARDPGTYSEEIVQEFYASYAATLRGRIHKNAKLAAQDPLTSTMVRGISVNLSHTTINRFFYSPNPHHTWADSTAEFDYLLEIVRTGAFGRNADQREAVISWHAQHLALDGERVEWVVAPQLGIRKPTLTLASKFFWLLGRNRLSSIMADNIVTWDKEVMVAALVVELDINFSRLLLGELHERAFKTTTTYQFPCMIFQLCRDARVPIWHCGKLVHATGTLDIGLIQDNTNVAAPRRGPRVDVPMGEDLIHIVGHMQGDDPPLTTAPPDENPTSSSQTASQAPSSSRATPLSGMTMIPLARV